MIVSFKVENFKSFNTESSISMVSSSKIHEFKNHVKRIKKTPILKNCVLYGANAAGKSNFVLSIRYMKHLLKVGLIDNATEYFCKNDSKNEKKNSKFEIILEINNHFYAYGFDVSFATNEFVKEWLYELHQDAEASLLFLNDGSKIELGDVKFSEEDNAKWNVYIDDFRGQKRRLFLTELNTNKNLSQKMGVFKTVFEYFMNNIVVLRPNQALPGLEIYNDEASLDKISKILNSFDTGIQEVHTREISPDELAEILPKSIYNDMIENIKIANSKKQEFEISLRSNRNFVNVFSDGDNIKAYTFVMMHGKSILEFDYEEESDGTKRIIDLLDMLLSKKKDTVYIVDELERSLHPKLTERFLSEFLKEYENDKTQLIFTTHDNSLMDAKLFRRDEIWFVERDEDNNSHFYSLDRFKLRADKKLSKDYLDGRYGAVPIFKEFNLYNGEV